MASAASVSGRREEERESDTAGLRGNAGLQGVGGAPHAARARGRRRGGRAGSRRPQVWHPRKGWQKMHACHAATNAPDARIVDADLRGLVLGRVAKFHARVVELDHADGACGPHTNQTGPRLALAPVRLPIFICLSLRLRQQSIRLSLIVHGRHATLAASVTGDSQLRAGAEAERRTAYVVHQERELLGGSLSTAGFSFSLFLGLRPLESGQPHGYGYGFKLGPYRSPTSTMVMVMVIYSALVRSHQSTSADSFVRPRASRVDKLHRRQGSRQYRPEL